MACGLRIQRCMQRRRPLQQPLRGLRQQLKAVEACDAPEDGQAGGVRGRRLRAHKLAAAPVAAPPQVPASHLRASSFMVSINTYALMSACARGCMPLRRRMLPASYLEHSLQAVGQLAHVAGAQEQATALHGRRCMSCT